jgi:hypothetical protein
MIFGLYVVLEILGQKLLPLSIVTKCMTNKKNVNFNFVLEDLASDESIHFLFDNFKENSETFISNQWYIHKPIKL